MKKKNLMAYPISSCQPLTDNSSSWTTVRFVANRATEVLLELADDSHEQEPSKSKEKHNQSTGQ